MYRALQHPLYPLLRKIDRQEAHVKIAQDATRQGRVIYASNHKSHTDYLVQPLVLDDNGIRPPVIAAGINLFGGALGLIHRHVTGAIPIRREMKDPAYLATLKAYVAEILQRHDLFLYLEGGRSYSGELKRFKTGLLHAARWPEMPDEAVIDELVQVRGIGRWTAEMFLMFNLLRPDVFPLADLGLQSALRRAYFGGRKGTLARMRRLGEGWAPWRSVATWYLWRSLDPVPVEY